MPPYKNRPFLARFNFAWAGLRHALRSERSLRTQVGIGAIVVVALAFVRPEPIWWALVLAACFSVIAAELFNTALEHLADHLHPDEHPQIGLVKDCAAAAVLMTVCGAIAVGVALIVHLLERGS
jgi:undecaprenol kinase